MSYSGSFVSQQDDESHNQNYIFPPQFNLPLMIMGD